ncbi:hypothetical protein NDU88_001487 [Pleurodeles waltl]|uniref:Uncharacterized protein n=1 Tax=Pleurodeles waltl TaxID=8319 RepID=A0AAV7V9T4_PLEWA|nr:hypothetical protein NDU88_001487 [Pleurodeles waltl]
MRTRQHAAVVLRRDIVHGIRDHRSIFRQNDAMTLAEPKEEPGQRVSSQGEFSYDKPLWEHALISDSSHVHHQLLLQPIRVKNQLDEEQSYDLINKDH